MSLENFSTRLKTAIDYCKVSMNQLAKSIGASNGYIGKIVSGEHQPSLDKVEKILHALPQINSQWLLLGIGNMLYENSTFSGSQNQDVHLSSTPISTPNPKTENLGVQNEFEQNQIQDPQAQYQKLGNMEQRQTNTIKVPILDTKAAASGIGYLPQGYIEEKDYVSFPSTLLKRGHQHIALQVKGDSMHPTLFDGDYIIACLLHSAEYPYMKNGKVYAIVSAERGVTIKRIHNHLVNFHFIRCNSDNRLHPTFDIQFQDITQIYEVVAKLSFNLPDESHNAYQMYISLEERMISLENRLQNIESHGTVESH